MSEKINVAEILKDCPKGMELYSPLCGKCLFDRLNFGTIICKKQNTQEITFTSKGYYMLPIFDDCECMIFPSKDQRDWSKFQRPFKDGDIVATNSGCFIGIVKVKNNMQVGTYCAINYRDYFKVNPDCVFNRFATKEEKQKLFDAIKENGYKWNAETKTLENLVEPKFKVGDEIKYKNGKNIDGVEQGVILSITDEVYDVAVTNNMGIYVSIAEQDDWELVPNKFDISTLKPFESRVLVRHNKDNKWCGSFFSHIDGNFHSHCYKYVTIAGKSYPMCIPYEGNEHLLGTTNDCIEYYKTWQ